jgi:hypothetical protein
MEIPMGGRVLGPFHRAGCGLSVQDRIGEDLMLSLVPSVLRSVGIGRVPLFLTLTAGAAACGSKSAPDQPKPAAVVFEDRLVVSDTDDKSPLRIPPAQLPTPGNCRLWYPERPPAQQPPVDSCAKAEAAATEENWILYRPREDPRLIHVRILDPDQAGAILRVRVYDAERGTYLGTRHAKRKQTR